MVCLSYQQNGTCKHFPKERCPVQKAARDMFGEIEMCKLVGEKLKEAK